MKKFAVIAAMNLLIVGLIAANAAMSIADGCGTGGCVGARATINWVLAVVLPLICLIGLAVAYRRMQADAQGSAAGAAVSSMREPSPLSNAGLSDAGAGPADPPKPVRSEEEALMSRLSRVRRVAISDAEAPPPAPPEAAPIAVEPAAAAFAAEAPFAAPVPTPRYEPALPADAGQGENAVADWDWLIDEAEDGVALADTSAGNAFPWVAAGIDHMCQALLTDGLLGTGTGLQAEAGAWSAVVAQLPRGQVLTPDDVDAFAAWLAQCFEEIGPDARTAVVGAATALQREARGDPALAAALPRELLRDGP